MNEDNLQRAKELYKEGKYRESLRINEQVIENSPDHSVAKITGLRYAGVCHYRLEEYEASKDFLNQAYTEAEHNHPECVPWIANHLGATLRRLGKPNEALQTFRDALGQTVGQAHVHARAELLLNLGVLYYQAGRYSLSDEHYARYEELCILFDDDDAKLSKAYGFMSGVERRRGRFKEAKEYADGEYKLACAVNQPITIFRALRHQATVCVEHAASKEGVDEELLSTAADLITQAEGAKQELTSINKVNLIRLKAKISMIRKNYPQALSLFEEALRVLRPDAEDSSFKEHEADILLDISEVSHTLRLNGDALYYLGRAADVMGRLLDNLSGGEASRDAMTKLFAPKYKQLQSFADRLLAEAKTVPRTDKEREGLVKVLKKLKINDADKRVAELAEVASLEFSIQQRFEEFWRTTLGDEVFQQLDKDSQEDLIRSEVVYHGAVADLGRAAHLVVIIFERELSHRFVSPALAVITADEDREELKIHHTHPSLYNICKLIRRITGTEKSHLLDKLRYRFKDHLDDLSQVLVLSEQLLAVDGREWSPRHIRNHIAHGNYTDRNTPTRMAVDTIRRKLLIGDESPLVCLTRIPRYETE